MSYLNTDFLLFYGKKAIHQKFGDEKFKKNNGNLHHFEKRKSQISQKRNHHQKAEKLTLTNLLFVNLMKQRGTNFVNQSLMSTNLQLSHKKGFKFKYLMSIRVG